MESLLFNKKIDASNYDEYIEKMMDIFRMSSSEKYIILEMKIQDNCCHSKMTIYDKNGISNELDDITLNCDEQFYSQFLNVLIHRIESECSITQKDIVNLDGDEFVAFRMITKYNDLFTVDGLTKEMAQSFEQISSNT